MEDVVADPAEEGSVLHQAEVGRLLLQLVLVGAGARDQEPRPGDALDQLRHRLEGDLEPLLVDEPADQEDEMLAGRRELGPEPLQLGLLAERQIARVDPVRDHGDPRLRHGEDVGDLLAHVRRAGDHAVGAVADPALDAMDVGLRMFLDPALMAAVLGRVDRRHQRRPEAPGEVIAGGGDEPIVPVDDVEVIAIAEPDSGGEHVRVHPLDPGDELAEVAGPARLEHAMDVDTGGDLAARRLVVATGEDVDLDTELDQALRQLADVAGQPALDQRRVLPGEDQDAHGRHAKALARACERE